MHLLTCPKLECFTGSLIVGTCDTIADLLRVTDLANLANLLNPANRSPAVSIIKHKNKSNTQHAATAQRQEKRKKKKYNKKIKEPNKGMAQRCSDGVIWSDSATTNLEISTHWKHSSLLFTLTNIEKKFFDQ